jgi:hypothetical protein
VDMRADQLCGLIEKYVVTCSRHQSCARSLIRGVSDGGPAKVTSPGPSCVLA